MRLLYSPTLDFISPSLSKIPAEGMRVQVFVLQFACIYSVALHTPCVCAVEGHRLHIWAYRRMHDIGLPERRVLDNRMQLKLCSILILY